jgi:hypothetical protein
MVSTLQHHVMDSEKCFFTLIPTESWYEISSDHCDPCEWGRATLMAS